MRRPEITPPAAPIIWRRSEVPESVYDNLVAAIQEGLPLLHDYVAVKEAGAG